MGKKEILFNDELGDYTLKTEINGVKSYKKVPIRYKEIDNTAKFRRKILNEEI